MILNIDKGHARHFFTVMKPIVLPNVNLHPGGEGGGAFDHTVWPFANNGNTAECSAAVFFFIQFSTLPENFSQRPSQVRS